MTSGPYEPQPEDRFTFVSGPSAHPGRDPFGVEVRSHSTRSTSSSPGRYRRVRRHSPRQRPRPADASASEREVLLKRFRAALDSTGLKVPMTTVNLFTRPIFKEGALTRMIPTFAVSHSPRRSTPLTSARSWAPASSYCGAVVKGPRPRGQARRRGARPFGRSDQRHDHLHRRAQLQHADRARTQAQ